jgi:hypothetical protein
MTRVTLRGESTRIVQIRPANQGLYWLPALFSVSSVYAASIVRRRAQVEKPLSQSSDSDSDLRPTAGGRRFRSLSPPLIERRRIHAVDIGIPGPDVRGRGGVDTNAVTSAALALRRALERFASDWSALEPNSCRRVYVSRRLDFATLLRTSTVTWNARAIRKSTPMSGGPSRSALPWLAARRFRPAASERDAFRR